MDLESEAAALPLSRTQRGNPCSVIAAQGIWAALGCWAVVTAPPSGSLLLWHLPQALVLIHPSLPWDSRTNCWL